MSCGANVCPETGCDEPIAKMAVPDFDADPNPDGSWPFIEMCPRRFTLEYAPRFPQHFVDGTFIAARCSQCGTLQVLTPGSPSCLQCKAHLAHMTPEKP